MVTGQPEHREPPRMKVTGSCFSWLFLRLPVGSGSSAFSGTSVRAPLQNASVVFLISDNDKLCALLHIMAFSTADCLVLWPGNPRQLLLCIPPSFPLFFLLSTSCHSPCFHLPSLQHTSPPSVLQGTCKENLPLVAYIVSSSCLQV